MKSASLLGCYLVLSLLSGVMAKKIAVIGAGITGSFVAHYLSEYDRHCHATGIDIYYDDSTGSSQGSRVLSFKLPDGRTVELGATILQNKFSMVNDLIRRTNLTISKPRSTGRIESKLRVGMGIYDQGGTWSLKENNKWRRSLLARLAWRYGWDLIKIQWACQKSMYKLDGLPPMLYSNASETYFASPNEIWTHFNLDDMVHESFDSFLDEWTMSNDSSYWWLPGSGSIRRELLEAVNLGKYNQNNSQMNALTGLGTYSALFNTKLFSIEGGNDQLITAAFDLAHQDRKSSCRSDVSDIQMVHHPVTTIIGNLDGIYLYSGTEILGHYDIVVLATPIQLSNITFLVPSQFDAAVLQPMPLGNLINAHGDVPDNHEGHRFFSHPVSMRYTQVVTTIVWDAALNASYFQVEDESMLPKTIFMTLKGKAEMNGISAISQLGDDLYKVLSDEQLSSDQLSSLFGAASSHHVKVWGGATPVFDRNSGIDTPFLIYDGAAGLSGHTSSGALYYPVAMEQSALSSVEMAAVGAKAVAKLIANRLGWIKAPVESEHDEL